MKILMPIVALVLLFIATAPVIADKDKSDSRPGLANSTLLIVRHAEKPDSGPGLSALGQERAEAYADYFTHFNVDGAIVAINSLVATADSKESERPRLTLEPLSRATGLPIENTFKDDDVKDLAKSLASGIPGRNVLIAWHHEKIPKLISDLGANAKSLIPDEKWPSDVFDWVVVLKYNADGEIIPEASRVIVEDINLSPVKQ